MNSGSSLNASITVFSSSVRSFLSMYSPPIVFYTEGIIQDAKWDTVDGGIPQKRREKYKIMKKNDFPFCPKYNTSRTAVQKKVKGR